MSRLLPHPLLSLALLGMWLLLTQVSPGHLLLGSVIALAAGRAMAALQPEGPRIRRWRPIPRLVAIVALDILRSNAGVAWLIVTGLVAKGDSRRSGFVEIPLRLRSPSALAILAIIVTATPGTAWLEHDAARGTLLLHVFDLVDEAGWQVLIRDRYESLLLEIFE